MYGGFLKTLCGLNIKGRYLEMGAGAGFLATLIAERLPGVEITAVDLSPDMARVAGEYIREKKLEHRIQYLTGDAADEIFLKKLGAFNLVYTSFSLHHWQEPEKSLRNLWNALSPGGAFCILDFRKPGWLCSLPLKWRELESMRASFSINEMEALLRKSGITGFQIRTPFPYLFQIVAACK
jgi:ubiquinone/menaquinone biosynthesis C-methylase UbiE